jgi:uncharacterized protein YbjT (DUF2867 family)
MILITGAAGKTGSAVLRALTSSGLNVRVLVHKQTQVSQLRGLGAVDAVIGDISNPADLAKAYAGVQSVYHICPNMHPDEVEIGRNAISAAEAAGVEHFVFHSVLHPQVQEMQHHWNKLLVEAQLFKSRLNFTIIQPASYMQNISGYWQKMVAEGVYAVPYSVDARFSMVDLEDIGHAAAIVVRGGTPHYRAVYELSGSQLLSSQDIARLAGHVLGRPVQAVELDRTVWDQRARAAGMPDYARTTLLSMFEYYGRHGFAGNSQVITMLLGRPPATFEEYLVRSLTPRPPE